MVAAAVVVAVVVVVVKMTQPASLSMASWRCTTLCASSSSSVFKDSACTVDTDPPAVQDVNLSSALENNSLVTVLLWLAMHRAFVRTSHAVVSFVQ